MSGPDRRPRVLLVGPYERDNVGDLLFLLVTEHYLRGANTVAGAPFAADMTPTLGRTIPAYPPLLERDRFDALWTVGGQVGSIGVSQAYRMSAPPEELRAFLGSERWKRRAILEDLDLGTAPYIPDPGPLNAGALRVLTSAGLSGARHVLPPRRNDLVALFRQQSVIAVRDRASKRFLAEHDIDSELVPDAVHALGIIRPAERNPDSDTVIFQASTAILSELGPEPVAAQLAGSEQLRGLKLRFLAAGTAPGLDSIAAYEDLAARIRQHAPRLDVDVLHDRRPFEIVDRIREARVVIGTSLHVRIIAATAALPRVSLVRPKVTRYAQAWDPEMPHGVALQDLDPAVERALERAGRPQVAAQSAELSDRAHQHLSTVAARVLARVSPLEVH